MKERESKVEVINYAGPNTDGPEKSESKKLSALFLFYWVPVLILSFVGVGCVVNKSLGWILLFIAGLITALMGTLESRKCKHQSTIIRAAVFLFLPTLLVPFAAYSGHQKEIKNNTRMTRIAMSSLSLRIDMALANEKDLNPSIQRPPQVVISTALKTGSSFFINGASNNDGWGRPFIFAYPGIHNQIGYDLYSAGPDGVYGNSDDIGNW